KCIVARFGDARLAESLEHLSVLVELEHLVAAAGRAWNVSKRTAVACPKIAIRVLAEPVGLYKHAVPERLENVAVGIEVNDGRFGTMMQPGAAMAVRNDADGRTGLDVAQMRPVLEHPVGIRHRAGRVCRRRRGVALA